MFSTDYLLYVVHNQMVYHFLVLYVEILHRSVSSDVCFYEAFYHQEFPLYKILALNVFLRQFLELTFSNLICLSWPYHQDPMVWVFYQQIVYYNRTVVYFVSSYDLSVLWLHL